MHLACQKSHIINQFNDATNGNKGNKLWAYADDINQWVLIEWSPQPSYDYKMKITEHV